MWAWVGVAHALEIEVRHRGAAQYYQLGPGEAIEDVWRDVRFPMAPRPGARGAKRMDLAVSIRVRKESGDQVLVDLQIDGVDRRGAFAIAHPTMAVAGGDAVASFYSGYQVTTTSTQALTGEGVRMVETRYVHEAETEIRVGPDGTVAPDDGALIRPR